MMMQRVVLWFRFTIIFCIVLGLSWSDNSYAMNVSQAGSLQKTGSKINTDDAENKYHLSEQSNFGEQLYQAICAGDLAKVQQLFDSSHYQSSEAVAAITSWHNGLTPLVLAASRHQYAIVNFLLEQGLSVDETTYTGETALHAAVEKW